MPGNPEIDYTSGQRSLEIAILQVVNDLMFVGRRLAFPLRAMRRDMLRDGVDDKAVTKAIQGARLLDCLGAAGVVSKTISGIPLLGGPGAAGAVELFIVVPKAVVFIEFENLPETIKRRIGFAGLRSVLGRVIGAMRGLCIDGRLTKVDHTGSMECAYMRPDGHHVYLNEWRESLCVSLYHPKSLIEFESAGAAVPQGHKGPEPYVRRAAFQGPIPLDATYPAYEITVAGRTIIEGLPSILDPTVHWPPRHSAIDSDKSNDSDRKTMSNTEAAKLYAEWMETKPDVSWIGKKIKAGQLAVESDDRTTEEKLAVLALKVLRRRRPKSKDGKPGPSNGREVCPKCNDPTHRLIGADQVCRECFLKQITNELPDSDTIPPP